MKKSKACGYCHHITNEDSNGYGYCPKRKKGVACFIDFGCDFFKEKTVKGNDLKGIKDLFKKAGVNI